MIGINRVTLIGFAGGTPSMKTVNGGPLSTFRLATKELVTDAITGKKEARIEWHRVALFGKLADRAFEEIRENTVLYIEGSLKTRSWREMGGERTATEIVAHEMQILTKAQP